MSSVTQATGAMLIPTNAYVITDFLFQIFCNNKIQQILRERQMLLQ